MRACPMAACFCCVVNRRLVLVGLVIDGQSEGHGVTPIDLSTKPGQPHKELPITMRLEVISLQADALQATQEFFRWCLPKGADVLLTVKGNQKTLHRQIQCQFQGKRHIPFTATAQGKKYGQVTTGRCVP